MLTLTLAILAQTAAAMPAATPAVAPSTKPDMTCRRYDVTGSLVKKQRVCRTAAAWARVEEDQRAEAERLRPHIGFERGN